MCMIVFIIVRKSGIHVPKGATPIVRFGVDEEESSPKKVGWGKGVGYGTAKLPSFFLINQFSANSSHNLKYQLKRR